MKIRDKLVLKNDRCRIDRPVFIKRINKDSVVFDYGEDSIFDIKYSFKTGRPVEEIPAWYDFKISTIDLEALIALEKTEKIVEPEQK